MENEKIVIIGGGIIGCATAYMIKRSNPGSSILILEKSNDLAHESSYQNGGVLTYTYHQPWKGNKILYKCLEGYFSPDPYYKVTKSALWDPEFWLWAVRFWLGSFFGHKKRDDLIFTLSKRSWELHSMFRHELLTLYKPCFQEYLGTDQGLLKVYSTISEFQAGKAKGLELNLEYGEQIHINSSRNSCFRYEPSMKDWELEIVGCIKNHLELFCAHNSKILTENFARVAQYNGTIIEYNSEVESFEIQNQKVVSLVLKDGRVVKGDKFIICGGTNSKNLGKQLGWSPPIWPVKGYTFEMETSKALNHSLHLTSKYPFYIAVINNRYRVSGICEFTDPNDKNVPIETINFIQDYVTKALKIEDAVFSNYWACHRPTTSDDLPIIGQFPGLGNVFINSGHGSKGSILALGSAELITHIISGTSPLIEPSGFSPNRFYV